MDDRAPKLLNPLHWPRRTQALALLVPLVIFLLLLIRHPRSTTSSVVSFFSNTPRCPPEAWALGSWVQRPGPWPTMGGPVDVFRVSGFSGCASSNEPWFHLAHENASMWEWRAQVSTYDWRPGSGCSMQEFDKQKFIQDLLARGGWHMVGDSMTEAHFFSLSCLLHPFVRAGPVYDRSGGWKRSWPQFLYLDTAHPWVQALVLPLGFDASVTPIVSHKRIDLLFSLPELADVGAWIAHPTADPASYFKDGAEGSDVWTQSAIEWLADFEAMLPAGRYATLILSSGVHWLPDLFVGAQGGMTEVVRLWRISMNLLTARLVAMLEHEENKRKVVVFRSASRGSEGCLNHDVRMAGPVRAVPELKEDWFNWRWLPHMNDVLEEIIRAHNHPRLRFVRLDRPGLLRPDAHALGDCSHYAIGTGVVEEWTRYLAHFLEHEVDYSR